MNILNIVHQNFQIALGIFIGNTILKNIETFFNWSFMELWAKQKLHIQQITL